MTDQPSNESIEPPMSVISYAPVEDDRSMNRLFRLAMGWFLICSFGIGFCSYLINFIRVITYSRVITGVRPTPTDWSVLIYYSIILIIDGIVVFAGILLLKRISNSIKIVRRSVWIYLIVGFICYSTDLLIMAFSQGNILQNPQLLTILSFAIGILGFPILPVFILALTSPRIAAIYK